MSDPMIEHEERGRAVVANGDLRRLRDRLGLTRTAMAELLHTSTLTYTGWESRPDRTLWPSTAERIGRFYTQAERALNELDEDLGELLPFYLAATYAGLPQEILLRFYREGKVLGVDLGILGLWLHRDDLGKLSLDQDFE